MVNTAQDFELLKWFCEYGEKRKKTFLDQTISLVENQNIPWPEEIITRLSQMMIDHVDQVLEHHPGHILFQTWQSISKLLKIFDSNLTDLICSLETFHQKAQSPDFHSRHRKKEFDQIWLQINKNMYNLASVSEALRQITLRFKGKFNPEGYISHFDLCYSDNKGYHFIGNLRNALHHQHFVEASNEMQQIFIKQETSYKTNFYLKSSELLKLSCFKTKARLFITEFGDKIYIRSLFDNHKQNINKFYDWVHEELNADFRFLDYQKCQIASKQGAHHFWWSIILQRMEEKGSAPYDYLEENFTENELAEIRKYPHRSKQQVDKIIELYDEDKVCTDSFRERIYKLFKVI